MQPGLVDRAEAVQDDADAQEKRRLHQAVTGDIDGRAGQPERGEQGDAGQEQAGMADGGESEQALEMPFPEAEQGADHRGQQPEGQEGAGHGGLVPERLAEHRPVHAGDPVQP